METFDELQTIWRMQPKTVKQTTAAALMQKGEAYLKQIRRGHFGTIAIITILLVVLIGYFIWVKALKNPNLTIGLSLMIVVMLARVVLEWISKQRFNSISLNLSFNEYRASVQSYYIWRKKVHTVFIPIIYILYTIGFTLLLPAFKANLSYGMYLYCVISGYGFLVVFAFFMVQILKKEMKTLDFLKKLDY